MKKNLVLFLALISFLSACHLTKKDLGLATQTPDETQVEVRQPLDLPPDFDTLPD